MFDSFPQDEFQIVGPNGMLRPAVNGIATGNEIIVQDECAVIEVGDEMRRRLPNGRDEVFVVLEPRFFRGFHDIPAHYQVQVRRADTQPSGQGGNYTISLHGANSRVNISSQDHSTNIANDKDVLHELGAALSRSIVDDNERIKMLGLVADMKDAGKGSGLLGSYNRFMASASDHMTVIAPFLPALASMLGGN